MPAIPARGRAATQGFSEKPLSHRARAEHDRAPDEIGRSERQMGQEHSHSLPARQGAHDQKPGGDEQGQSNADLLAAISQCGHEQGETNPAGAAMRLCGRRLYKIEGGEHKNKRKKIDLRRYPGDDRPVAGQGQPEQGA